ncbi:DNA cytosine methyltransferase, partial [Burkholderia cenocepacia]
RRAVRSTNEHAGWERGQIEKSITDGGAIAIKVRANRRIASGLDLRDAQQRLLLQEPNIQLKRRLTKGKKTLNIVELFAGAGGMGLGFLNARSADGRGYRIAGSAEIHPIYTQTLKQNHRYMEHAGLTPR